MNYKDYGKTGLKVSRFGMGCMRFPQKTVDGKTIIDQEETTRMVRHAIDQGVNYFDTAHMYVGSEEALGIALKGGYREKVIIVGKNPVFMAKSHEDLEKFLDEELARLQTDYLDVHFLHALNSERWKKSMEIDALRFLDEMKKAGKIRFAGFSFHGRLEDYKTFVDAYDWDIVQIQLNFLDVKHQAGLEGLHYAADKGLPVVIMEPLRGGALVDKLPEGVKEAYDNYPIKRSPAEWSFRWLIDKPEVTCVISGVSTMDQLRENIRIFSETDEACMTPYDHAVIDRVVTEFEKGRKVDCTRCGYCMPCPSGVDIPEVFQFYNDLGMESYKTHARIVYQNFMVKGDESSANFCTECGECEPLCPQTIPIIDMLKEAHEDLIVPASR